jgi:hypothetical protein
MVGHRRVWLLCEASHCFLIFFCVQPAEDPTDDTYPHVYEQSLDRLACAVGGKAVLPAAFQHIPGMLASHDWKLRHAGLMAIASVAEGTSKVTPLPCASACVTDIFPGDAKRAR